MRFRDREDAVLTTNLDTVIINTDESLLVMLSRTNLPVRNGPHEVAAMRVTSESFPWPPPGKRLKRERKRRQLLK